MKINKVAFGELQSSDYLDFYRLFKMPRGIPYLAAQAKERGINAVCYVGSVRKISIKELIKEKYDLIGFSVITCTINPTVNMIKQLKRAGYGGPIIVGGPHATAKPEEVLMSSGADVAIRHEGDKTLFDVIQAYEEVDDIKKVNLKDIKGISYWLNGNIVHNLHDPKRDFLTPEELSALPPPAMETIIGYEKIKHFPIAFSRSCPMDCKFCYAKSMFGKFRCASVESRMQRLEYFLSNFPNVSLFFADDNFFGNMRIGKEMLNEIIARRLVFKKGWTCQMRVDDASPEIASLLKRAGCTSVCLGIESTDAETLKVLNKRQTVEDIEEGLRNLHAQGIKTLAMTIAGTDTDTFRSIFRGVRQLKKWGVTFIQILPLVPLPCTVLTYEMLHDEGRSFPVNNDRYNGMHVLIKPKKMTKFGVWSAVWIGYIWWYLLDYKMWKEYRSEITKMVTLVILQCVKWFTQSVKERIVPAH